MEYHWRRERKNLNFLQYSNYNKECDSLAGIGKIAEKLGFRTKIASLDYQQLTLHISLPCILQLDGNHPVVVLPFPWWKINRGVKLMDPAMGIKIMGKNEFVRQWLNAVPGQEVDRGMVLLLEPMPDFEKGKRINEAGINWGIIFQYLQKNKGQILKLMISLLVASFLQFLFPFLTQSLVDAGINARDLNYIVILLVAQLMLVFSRTLMDFIRNHLLLYISTTFNLSVLSDFWIKLMKLPITYFDQRKAGEILQRIEDNKQIQDFLTGPALQTLFAGLNFIVFSFVLISYKFIFFVVYMSGISVYFIWMLLFLKIRRKINYEIFHSSSSERNSTLQLIQGMQEIKLLGIGQSKRWEWESIQSEIFRLNYRSLSIGQIQQAGAIFINQGKDIVLTFLVAEQVIKGQLTFGALLAVQYIIGQLSGPVEQFIRFIQEAQNAKISMDRLNEVHRLENEECNDSVLMNVLPPKGTIRISNLCFEYDGQGAKHVLKDIQLEIPEGKVTAIVGVSGSGKTTLLKILLKFHVSYKGKVSVGGIDLNEISSEFWRRNCAALLQDAYIFNDTIEKNIAVEFGKIDYEKLSSACEIANIRTFIESLPDGFKTKLGVDGVGLSQGQKQRLLIARAVYKNPKYIFFDESTNALDANTEMVIVENLKQFFKNKTVVIVAHRLSTVKNADKIVVLDSGRIIEQGNHYELSNQKGSYYELVRNQLELNV